MPGIGLICNVQGGAVVLSLQGPLKIEPIVAQGCRPLTDSTWLVEESENNIITQVCLNDIFVSELSTSQISAVGLTSLYKQGNASTVLRKATCGTAILYSDAIVPMSISRAHSLMLCGWPV